MKNFDARIGKKLAKSIISDLRFFGYYIGNETLILDDTDMSVIYEPSNALGNIYLLKLFGTYAIDFSYIDNENRNPLSSIKTYINSIHLNSIFKLPISSNDVIKGTDWRYALVRFMLDLGNRNLNTQPLINYKEDYCLDVIDYGNSMEMITAIFCNTLRMDKQFNIINEDWVRHRTSQYIRLINDDTYNESPKFKQWETMLWV